MAEMNCDPAYLASISDPTAAANAALACAGVQDTVVGLQSPAAPGSAGNPVSNAGTNWAGAIYGDITTGATSVVNTVHTIITTASSWAGEVFNNIIGWKLLVFLLVIAYLVWKFV